MPRNKNPSASRGAKCDPRAAETEYSPDDLEGPRKSGKNPAISGRPATERKGPQTIRSKTGSLGYNVPTPEFDANEYRGETVPASFAQTEDETGFALPGSKLATNDPEGSDLSSLVPEGHHLRLSSGGTSFLGPKAAPAIQKRKRRKIKKARRAKRGGGERKGA